MLELEVGRRVCVCFLLILNNSLTQQEPKGAMGHNKEKKQDITLQFKL